MSQSAPLARIERKDSMDAALAEPVMQPDSVRHANGSIHHVDGTIDHPDGTVEFDGYLYDLNWDELDPPEGDPGAEEIPHEVVMAEICAQLGLPPGSL